MAKNIVFRDIDNVELQVYTNQYECAVLVLDHNDEVGIIYQFDDKQEIEDLISELERVKNLL